MKKTVIASILALSAAFSVQAKDIVDTAVGAGTFKTLAAALTAAGLIDTLKGPGSNPHTRAGRNCALGHPHAGMVPQCCRSAQLHSYRHLLL